MAATFSDTDLAWIATSIALMDAWAKVRETMPAQYIRMFLAVAADEGKSVQEYGTKLGIVRSVASRHILDLGDHNRDHEPGFGLLMTRTDDRDTRIKRVYLTPQGKALMHGIIRAQTGVMRGRL